MNGDSAEKINKVLPPSSHCYGQRVQRPTVGDSLLIQKNKKVEFLTRAFFDLVTNPNILNVGEFIHKFK